MKNDVGASKQRERGEKPGRHGRYQIQVKGALDDNWSEWFGELTVNNQRADDGSMTSWLIGAFADQSALRGVLNKIWDLNLTLLAVELVDCTWGDKPRTGSSGRRRRIVDGGEPTK